MKRVDLAKWVPLVAFALAVPASAIAASDQANTGSDTKDQDKSGAAKGKAHGPTAVMDRATPTQKSGTPESSNKHPPTARMDRATPNEKSPGSKSSGDSDAKSTEEPSAPK